MCTYGCAQYSDKRLVTTHSKQRAPPGDIDLLLSRLAIVVVVAFIVSAAGVFYFIPSGHGNTTSGRITSVLDWRGLVDDKFQLLFLADV